MGLHVKSVIIYTKVPARKKLAEIELETETEIEIEMETEIEMEIEIEIERSPGMVESSRNLRFHLKIKHFRYNL